MSFFKNCLMPLSCMVILTVTAFSVSAELIDGRGGYSRSSTHLGSGGGSITGSVQLQCWQYGNKIIDEKGLQATTNLSFGEAGSLSFRREGDSQEISVILVSNPNATCLIKNDR